MSSMWWYFLWWFIPLNLYAIVIWLICTVTGKRLQFIEISDQNWCPQLFRECVRNGLHYGWVFFGLTDYFGSPALTVFNIISPYFTQLKCNLVIDLCSGSGGPTPNIHQMLNNRSPSTVQTLLTDLFPQVTVWKYQCSQTKHLLYSSQSVDAANINILKIQEISAVHHNKTHFRTLFGSFHHFKPDLAIAILANAMECNDAFIMSEVILRRKYFFDFIQWPLQLTLLSPLFVVHMIINHLLCYDVNDRSVLQRIGKCLLIVITAPIWLAVFVHDGIISNARVYTEKELMELTECAKAQVKCTLSDKVALKRIDDYEWKCWRQNSDMMFPLGYVAPITVLLGVPHCH
eukprot:114060_1